MELPEFRTLTLQAPTYESIAAEYAEIRTSFEGARSAAKRRAVLERWDRLRKSIDTWSALVSLRFNQDTRNATYKQDREMRDALMPKLLNLGTDFKKVLLDSPHRPALEAELGAHVFSLWDADRRSYDPVIEKDMIQESRLCADYTELLSSPSFAFRGERLTLSELTRYVEVGDRAVRREAQQLRWQWFADNGETFDRIYDELVTLRAGMAEKLTLDDFVELGYIRIPRIGFGRAEVELFRAQVREFVVPLCTEIRRRQAERLGLKKILFWDEAVHDPKGNPRPKGDHDWMLRQAQSMFDELGGGLGAFFGFMREHDLLDLKPRPGKAGGGFCTCFIAYGAPYIFANFNGTKGDVEVFTHEMGHAFQVYASRHLKPMDYCWPTLEACEIHSMSLEFLTWPWMDRFFGEDADRIRWLHLAGSLLLLPYGVAVDHFQHLVYETPDATPADRRAMWEEMERLYLPWRDYADLPHVGRGGLWQAQRHVYLWPFYYLDYTLATTCALQIWVRAEEDRGEALSTFLKLCERGGDAPFHELVRGAGLVSPFQNGCLEDVVAKARSWLEI